jgi:alpha-mannosidase
MLKEIRKRVNQRRWEVTASTWLEADKNMPSRESLARHVLYTMRYLSSVAGHFPGNVSAGLRARHLRT